MWKVCGAGTQSIEATCGALGYRTGPLNFDAIVSPGRVTLLEMSARNGGNGIPAVIERATGVDVEQAAIALALGERPRLPRTIEIRHGVGSYVFGSLRPGVLVRIATPEELRRRAPEVFDVNFVKHLGDTIEPFEHNGNLIGFALFACNDSAHYERVTEKINEGLDIVIRDD